MKNHCPWALSAALVCFAALPAHAASNNRERVRIESTDRFTVAPDALIRLDDSFGEVDIEGWDQPAVEFHLIKKTQRAYGPEEQDEGLRHLESIRITTSQSGKKELTISTRFPSRNLAVRPLRGKTNADLVYRLKVPRQRALRIRHDVGEVQVKDVRGDLNITSSIGEIVVALPGGGRYLVDARAGMGDVSSAFGGEAEREHLIGAHLLDDRSFDARRLYLRVGIGSIEVKKISEPAPKE